MKKLAPFGCLLLVFVLSMVFITTEVQAQLRTNNNYVAAIVEGTTGRITIRLAPGTANSPILSFPDKSFLTVMIGDKIFTNNNVGLFIGNDPRFGGQLNNGTSRKIGDTIQTTWLNKNGCDIIQEVYPVALRASGQIVMRWKVRNPTNTPVWAQNQFLLDLQVGGQNPNDGAPTLTRYGYRPIWEQYTKNSTYDIPWFIAAFEEQLPNSPTFETGITGVGYNQDINYILGLKKPSAVTVGDWGSEYGVSALVDFLWGLSPNIKWGDPYTDAAILFQWDGTAVGTNRTTEISRTSYGTGEFGTCTGQLFGIVFYPRQFTWDKTKYDPDTANVEFYAFDVYSPLPQDPNYGPPSSGTYLKIHCGPNLRVVKPDTVRNASNTTQRQQTDPVGYIPQYGVGTAFWKIVADKAVNCSGDITSWLKFHAESSLGGTGPIFFNSGDADTCEHQVLIQCVEEDFIAPAADTGGVYTFPFQKTLNVYDNRPKDRGLDKITYAPQAGSGTNLSNFQIDIPTYTPCDKTAKHLIRVTQKDSTIGGCIDFTITDCAGNDSVFTICLPPHPKNPLIDTLPPVFTTIFRTPGDTTVPCNGRCDSILITDNRQFGDQYDVGLRRIDPQGVVNMNISTLNPPFGAKVHSVKICVVDTMLDASATLIAVDTVGNQTTMTYTYCTIKDTIAPKIQIDKLAGRGNWSVTVREEQPWDRRIDSIILINMNNVMVTSNDPTYPNAKNQEVWSFTMRLVDTTKSGGFCVYATDQASPFNRSQIHCANVIADPDSMCPNFVVTPSPGPNVTRISVAINDYHVTPQGDTLGWDKGIDSVWFTGARGIITPAPFKAGCVMTLPPFTLTVEDTLDTDSIACVNIHAKDCADNECVYTWCYPYNPDDLPPIIRVWTNSRAQLGFAVADTQLYDRGIRQVTMKGEDNFTPVNVTLNRDARYTPPTPISRPNYTSSSYGILEAVDYWGTLVSGVEREAHTASVELSVWVQDLQMKKGEMVEEPGTFELPIRFVKNDTFSLIRKGIDEIDFTFTLTGDVDAVNFLGVRTQATANHLSTAADGWVFDPMTPVGNNMYRIHGVKPAGGTSLNDINGDTLLALQFSAVKNEFTKDVLVSINEVGGETVVFNGNLPRTVKGKNAEAILPAPYGTLSGSHIVIVGSCAPSVQTALQPPSIVSLEQNSPNPFTGKTTLSFTVKEDGMVKLAVYDMLGQEVESLVNTILARGRYTVRFDGSRYSGGNYIARLQANGSVRSRTMHIER